MERRNDAGAGLLRRLAAVSGGAVLALSCGTGAAPAGGDRDLPNARVGPFRVLREGETSRKAPFVFENGLWRDPEIVDLGEAAGERSRLYFTGGGDASYISAIDLDQAIVRPDSVPARVLEALEPWEQGTVGQPSILRENGAFILFYGSSSGCIGRAVSADGLTFVREPTTPVLCGDGVAVGSPSVVRGADGTLRMFHSLGSAIAESRSADGLTFALGAVILTPSGIPQSYDEKTVGDPYALPVTASSGRSIRYVYFTATGAKGLRSVGVAARFDDDGPLERARDAVLTRFEPRSPTVLVLPAVTLLYAGSRRAEVGNQESAILAGIAPATESRPLVLPKASSATP